MKLFLAIALLVTLSLLATSPRFYRLRRAKPAAMLLSGGWLAIGAGMAIGPSGLGAIDRETIRRATPLLLMGLGWIGLMVGLQARWSVLKRLPRPAGRLASLDAMVTLGVFGPTTWLLLGQWTGHTGAIWLLAPTALLASGAIGWAMETRSLQLDASESARHRAVNIRGAGGLGALIAVCIYGVLLSFVTRGEGGEPVISARVAAMKIPSVLVLAGVVGLLARVALRIAGRNKSELLVVFLGVVVLVAGVADHLAASTLFAAALTGAIIANFAAPELRRFERFILQAEHVVAVIFLLLAGVLIDPLIGWWGVGLATGLALLRVTIKPMLFRVTAARDESGWPKPSRWPVYAALARQSPLAIALAVGLVLAEPSVFRHRLLAVVVLAGLLSELPPLAVSAAAERRQRRERRRRKASTDEPALGSPTPEASP